MENSISSCGLDKEYEELIAAFEGKTVKKVSPLGGEYIALFEMTDGAKFRLGANDLGFWIEELAGKEGYKTLYDLSREYNNDLVDNKIDTFNNDGAAIIELKDNWVNVLSPSGKIFSINKDRLAPDELIIINDDVKREILAYNIVCGCGAVNCSPTTKKEEDEEYLEWLRRSQEEKDKDYEEEKRLDEEKYPNINKVAEKYEEDEDFYSFHSDEIKPSLIEIKNNIINITSPKNKTFTINKEKLTSEELNIINDDIKRETLAYCIHFGSIWGIFLKEERSDEERIEQLKRLKEGD
jgi:hypothetical protein